MKMMIGFFGSYSVGFEPSRMPPCAGALAVLVAVTMLATMPLLTVIVVVTDGVVGEAIIATVSRARPADGAEVFGGQGTS